MNNTPTIQKALSNAKNMGFDHAHTLAEIPSKGYVVEMMRRILAKLSISYTGVALVSLVGECEQSYWAGYNTGKGVGQ